MPLPSLQPQGRSARRAFAFALAAALPVLAAAVTTRVPVLHSLPYSLHFTAMVVVASIGGLSPALLCIAVSVLTQAIFPSQPDVLWPLTLVAVLRPSFLVASAVIISLLTRSRRRAAEALEAALVTLRDQAVALVESQQASKCASWTYNGLDRIRWLPGGYEVFGMDFAEVEQHASPIDLILAEDQPNVRRAVAKMVASSGQLLVEYRTVWPNGELHWNEARGNPVPGDINLWRGVTFDITERKLSEIALIQNEKLAAMGRLASTVAHEINNPLEAVTNLLYLARTNELTGSETDEHLALAEKELARLSDITRLTLGFVRNSSVRADVDMVEVLEDVLSIFNHRLEMKNIHVDRLYGDRVQISIAPHELRQIAVNLISNASDALSQTDARISVSVHRLGDTAVLTISDNGSGIAGAHLQSIFEPFFTTKAEIGTGIGLWVTRELVEKNGGSISAESGNLPGGLSTSFRVAFPVSLAGPNAASGGLAIPEASPGNHFPDLFNPHRSGVSSTSQVELEFRSGPQSRRTSAETLPQ